MIEDLVYRGVAEAGELDFRNRLQPFDRHAYAHAGDEAFGKRCIDYALCAKTLGEAQRGAEHAAIHTHVLAEHDDRGIVLHLAFQRQIDGFNESDLRHLTSRDNTGTIQVTRYGYGKARFCHHYFVPLNRPINLHFFQAQQPLARERGG